MAVPADAAAAALSKSESMPVEILNSCAYGEPSTKTIAVMGLASALLAAGTVYLLVKWARKSARQKFKDVCKSVFSEVDHDKSGLVDSDELYTAVLLVYLQVNKAIRVIGAVKPPNRASVDQVLAKYEEERGAKPGAGLTDEQFEDVMKVLSKDVAGRVTITCGFMLGCPMLGAILVEMFMAKFGRSSHFGPCGSVLFKVIEPQLPTLVSVFLMLVFMPMCIDAVDAYLEGRKSKLEEMAEKAKLVSMGSTTDVITTEPAPAADIVAEAVGSARDEAAAKAEEVAALNVDAPPKATPLKKKSSFSAMFSSSKKKPE